jgi:hypothetical protein
MSDTEQLESTGRQHRTIWWKEALIVTAFYGIYTLVRNLFGSALVSGSQIPVEAFLNAMRIIRFERALGLYHEETIQDWFLPHVGVIEFFNVYYGTAHFFITLGVFVALFLLRPTAFALWRNCLAAMTALAIIGFALFPLMPPRLLDASCPPVAYGAACIKHELRTLNGAENFGYSDTIKEFGGPWAFDRGPGRTLSNQYAAMPSLHIGWATWCVFAMFPLARRTWIRLALLLYPLLTLAAIVITGNHFWIDGLGGIAVFTIGYWIGARIHRWNERRVVLRRVAAAGHRDTLQG